MKNEILKKVANGQMSPSEAFYRLYDQKPKRANFVRLQMRIKESAAISGFINLLFFLPIPIVLGKIFIFKALKKQGISPDIYYDVIKYGGGTSIKVDNEDAKITIYIF